MQQPTVAQFLVEFVLGAVAGTAVFFHAERAKIRHPSGWASAVFLVLPIALPLYLFHAIRTRRARRLS